MFGQSLLSAFGIACTTDTDQLFTVPTSSSAVATYELNSNANSIPYNESITSTATYQLNSDGTSIPSNTYPLTTNGITFASGKFGNAAGFSSGNPSTGDYMKVSNSIYGSSTTVFSWSLWIKCDNTTGTGVNIMGNGALAGGQTGYTVFLYNGRLALSTLQSSDEYFPNPESNGTLINDNQWHHIVLTYNNGSFVLYLDGSPNQTGTSSNYTNNATPANDTYIGNSFQRGISDGIVNGQIDQVRVFGGTILNQDAVTALYNETTTTAQNDYISYTAPSYNGTASNITYAAGKFDNAAVFNGSNTSINIGASNNFASNKLTISFWANPGTANPSNYQLLFSNYIGGSVADYDFIIDRQSPNHASNAEKLEVGISGSGSAYLYILTDSAVFTPGTWKNYVIVFDTTESANIDKIKIYVNGTLAARSNVSSSGTVTGSLLNTSDDLLVGTWPHDTSHIYSGLMDQVRIFNTALTQTAITALYNETTTTAQSNNIDYLSPNPNSVAYYKMSDATDQLGNYNGTATNVNFNTEGKFGFAGKFNGSSSKIVLPTTTIDSIKSNGSFGVSAWFKTSETGDRKCIFSAFQSSYLMLEVTSGNQLKGIVSNSVGTNTELTVPITVTDGNWHHAVFTGNNGSLSLYLDNGTPQTSSSWNGTFFSGTGGIGIGIRMASSDYWDGDIDQIRLYDSVLSAANVSTLYKEVECSPAAINALANFNTVTYDGTGGSQSTNSLSNQAGTLGFAPGMTWIKSRSNATWHEVHDVVRGNLPRIFPNDSYQELTSANGFASFDSNGFSLDAAGSGGDVNTSGRTYVAWNWKTALANLSTGFNGSSTVGSASKIDLTGSTTLTTRSISLWVNLAGTGSGGNLILDNSDGQNPGVVQYGKWVIQLQYGGTNYFCWDTYTGGSYGICDVNYTFNLNTWYHIVFVAEANNQAVYINGVSQTLQNVSRAGDIGTVTMSTNRLGASWSTQYTHALNGKMGQVRIFNDALTANEVADLYTEPAASNNTLNYPAGAGCIAAYPLQTNAVDLSGNYSGASSNVTFGQPGYLTSNTDGTITSTVAANPEAGFSIVQWTGTRPTAGTLGHGLGLTPEMIIIKNTSIVSDWTVYAESEGPTTHGILDTNGAWVSNAGAFNNTSPTSNVFTVGGDAYTNGAGNSIIAYCFRSIPGYSKIGFYVGTAAAGNFQYTGFQPSWLMVKCSSAISRNWVIVDDRRGNSDYWLYPNTNDSEQGPYTDVVFNSTGFTLGTNASYVNGSGDTYIFLAIA
jgi:hypothetical protein